MFFLDLFVCMFWPSQFLLTRKPSQRFDSAPFKIFELAVRRITLPRYKPGQNHYYSPAIQTFRHLSSLLNHMGITYLGLSTKQTDIDLINQLLKLPKTVVFIEPSSIHPMFEFVILSIESVLSTTEMTVLDPHPAWNLAKRQRQSVAPSRTAIAMGVNVAEDLCGYICVGQKYFVGRGGGIVNIVHFINDSLSVCSPLWHCFSAQCF